MTNLTDRLRFSVPLTQDAHQIAGRFSREQDKPEKAQQVYLNTLAVYAVNFYFNCMEVETELEASDSWNPALRSLMDVSDLMIKNWGRLECRPVLPNAQFCHVPPESRQDRVGYVVVEINQAMNQAKLLGFAQTAPAGVLDISQLDSLEPLINQLPEEEQIESDGVILMDWLKECFEVGWQGVQELVSPQLRPVFRATEVKQQERAKLIDLGLELAGHGVVLIITVREVEPQTVSVRAQVYPTGEAITLPPNLKLSVLTETGAVFKAVTARSDDEFIQYQFKAQQGDCFKIQVALGDVSLTEKFKV